MPLFTEKIDSWHDWGEVFQSISAFAPLVRRIFEKEALPAAPLENLTPGTNAVFKAGGYVVKIFAPEESGMDQTSDLETELFSARRCMEIGVSAPKLVASGQIRDKYDFAYMITEYIEGTELCAALTQMTTAQKMETGRALRAATDKLNVPCTPFNKIDVITDTSRHRRWDKYTARFREQRLEYISSRGFGERVFVHGDLCSDNILLTPRGELCIIDFADAVLAPLCYEHAHVAIELFAFDPALICGFFGEIDAEKLAGICTDGILIHDFGGDIVANRVAHPSEICSVDGLRDAILQKITENRSNPPSGK